MKDIEAQLGYLNKQVITAQKIAPILDSVEWGILRSEMLKELERLTLLTEEPGFIEKAGLNPTILADNLSFKRGIRYVLEHPERLIRAGRGAAEKLQSRVQPEIDEWGIASEISSE